MLCGGEQTNTHIMTVKIPIDTAVLACNVKLLDLLLDCVDLNEQVKTRMVSNAYTNLFHREFSQITKDHVSMVKRLLELGADVNGGPSDFPMSVATKAGSYPLVELLCQHGADLSKKIETFTFPPLTIAAKGGHCDMIEVMLKCGANVHDKVEGFSPVDMALVHGHTDCATLLVQHGATVNAKYILFILIENQNVACINFLLVNCRHEIQEYICKDQQDLLLAAVRGTNVEFLSYIYDILFDITGEYPYLEELLAESKSGEIASFLIQKGVDVNNLVETCDNYTPLYLVLRRERELCQTSKLQVVKVLLENWACPNICGDTSPLICAVLNNSSTDLLQLLLDYGADINWTDSKGDTAFSYSVYQGYHNIAEFLIRYAEDQYFVINSQNNEGLTVLMQAARYSNVAVVKRVINHNPTVNLTDNNGNTALLHAVNRTADHGCVYETVDIVTTLINAGCDVNLQNNNGLSPLMLAASRYSKEVVQILLDAGADINATSKTYRTETAVSYFLPVSYICGGDKTACLEMFFAQGACLSYLQPRMFHRILLCNDSDIICKLITSGTGPLTVRSDKYFNYLTPHCVTFDISPLCTALVSGNASLARHFVDIMWLTKSDLTSLIHNKPVRSYLEKRNHTHCLNLLGEMSSQPASLLKLAFVEVSSTVGTTPGRENRVNKLPLPHILKDKLLFKSTVDFTIPIIDWIPYWPSFDPFDSSYKICICLLYGCKCCRVWYNLESISESRAELNDSQINFYRRFLQ